MILVQFNVKTSVYFYREGYISIVAGSFSHLWWIVLKIKCPVSFKTHQLTHQVSRSGEDREIVATPHWYIRWSIIDLALQFKVFSLLSNQQICIFPPLFSLLLPGWVYKWIVKLEKSIGRKSEGWWKIKGSGISQIWSASK